MHSASVIDTPQTSSEGLASTGRDASPARHGWLWQTSHSLAWLTALALFAIAACRIYYHDGNYLLTCINAFTRYVYLPIYVCWAWATWQRRKVLFCLSAVVAGCHVAFVAPEFLRDTRFDAPSSAEGKTLRIMFANVLSNHGDPVAYLQELSDFDPDVVVFVEYYPWWHRGADPVKSYAAYPYGTMKGQGPGGEIGVFSKLPIENTAKFVAAQRMCFSFDVQIDGRSLRILALHSPRPMLDPETDYNEFWAAVTPRLLSIPDPAVIVGDFNATPYSLVFKTLTAGQLRSAHEDRGRGWATTWPNGMSLAPPIRIDQALLTPGVECVSIQEGRGFGSDHKPLILDVRLRPVPPSVGAK